MTLRERADEHHVYRLFEARARLARAAHEAVAVPDVARAAGISRFHFVRLYQRVFRETPRQTAISARLCRAKDLLTETDLSITEICFECGYESLGSFSDRFRRHTGVSPGRFRQQRRRFWPVNIALLRPMVPYCLLAVFGREESQNRRSFSPGGAGILTVAQSQLDRTSPNESPS